MNLEVEQINSAELRNMRNTPKQLYKRKTNSRISYIFLFIGKCANLFRSSAPNKSQIFLYLYFQFLMKKMKVSEQKQECMCGTLCTAAVPPCSAITEENMEKQICPLLALSQRNVPSVCQKEKCAWWKNPDGWEEGCCAIVRTSACINFISDDIEENLWRIANDPTS